MIALNEIFINGYRYQKAGITLTPVVGVIIMMLSVIVLSKRENMTEFNSSLENIDSIDKIKWKKYL